MTGKTSIEWATAVWNPTTGCTRVSAGCDHCYAFALHDKRHASSRDALRSSLRLGRVPTRSSTTCPFRICSRRPRRCASSARSRYSGRWT